MINLVYNATYWIRAEELFDAGGEGIEYEVLSRQSGEWAAMARDWLRNGAEDAGRALDLVALAFVAVRQNGQTWPLGSREQAEALREAIEAQNPGHGDTFICHLALAHYNHHFARLSDRLGNWRAPLAPSGAGGGNSK